VGPTRARVNEVRTKLATQPTLPAIYLLNLMTTTSLDIAQLSSEQRALLELRLNRGKVKRTSRGISHGQTGLLRSRSPLRSLGSGWHTSFIPAGQTLFQVDCAFWESLTVALSKEASVKCRKA